MHLDSEGEWEEEIGRKSRGSSALDVDLALESWVRQGDEKEGRVDPSTQQTSPSPRTGGFMMLKPQRGKHSSLNQRVST